MSAMRAAAAAGAHPPADHGGCDARQHRRRLVRLRCCWAAARRASTPRPARDAALLAARRDVWPCHSTGSRSGREWSCGKGAARPCAPLHAPGPRPDRAGRAGPRGDGRASTLTVGLHLERRGRVSVYVLGPAIAATVLGGVELERRSHWQNWAEPLSGLGAGPSTFWGPGPDSDSGPDTAAAICRLWPLPVSPAPSDSSAHEVQILSVANRL